MQESLLNDKESDLDQVRHFEKLNYHNNAGCFSKLSFSWIFNLIQVSRYSFSSDRRIPSIRKISRISAWRTSHSQSIRSGMRIGAKRLKSTPRILLANLYAKLFTVMNDSMQVATSSAQFSILWRTNSRSLLLWSSTLSPSICNTETRVSHGPFSGW